MVQKLQFESAWDRTIADQDREKIIHIFDDIKLPDEDDIQFTTLQTAINHKDELLVTVLIHNTSNKEFKFDQDELCYIVDNKILAKSSFSLPALLIEKQTSMPWTFIFSEHLYNRKHLPENGVLRFTE